MVTSTTLNKKDHQHNTTESSFLTGKSWFLLLFTHDFAADSDESVAGEGGDGNAIAS
jgi:hypothetical protein